MLPKKYNNSRLSHSRVFSGKTRAVNKTEQVILVMLGPGTVITRKLICGHRTVALIEIHFRVHRLGRDNNSHTLRGKNFIPLQC